MTPQKITQSVKRKLAKVNENAKLNGVKLCLIHQRFWNWNLVGDCYTEEVSRLIPNQTLPHVTLDNVSTKQLLEELGTFADSTGVPPEIMEMSSAHAAEYERAEEDKIIKKLTSAKYRLLDVIREATIAIGELGENINLDSQAPSHPMMGGLSVTDRVIEFAESAQKSLHVATTISMNLERFRIGRDSLKSN